MKPEPRPAMWRDNFETKSRRGVLRHLFEVQVTEFDKLAYLEKKKRK